MRALLLAATLTGAPAQADPWFLHPFGELRSYHGDWLAVCAESGDGPCRAVQLALRDGDDPFFGSSRLAVHPGRDGRYRIEVYDDGMPEARVDQVVFDFGEAEMSLASRGFSKGSVDGVNVAETIAILDQDLAARIARLIREENRVRVRYAEGDVVLGEAEFSLRGSAAALRAIEAHRRQ